MEEKIDRGSDMSALHQDGLTVGHNMYNLTWHTKRLAERKKK
jgi:hypothetical protein